MKNFFLKLFFTSTLLITNLLQAQYTEVINSNKPGFSESPYSVGTGVYQFESNFFLKDKSIEPTFSQPKSAGFDFLFRTSFFLEKLELNTQLTYQKDKVAFKNIFTSSYNTSGISKLSVGAKYLVFQPEYTDKSKEVRSWKKRHAFDKKRLIPSVAVYAGMNTDFVNDIYKTGKITPKAGILLQHNLTNQFNIISNVYYDKIGTDFPEISYIVTATQNFGNRWSGFLEQQTVFLETQNNLSFGTGLAFLFNKDFQINASGRFLKQGKSEGFYAGLGISYRIDRHQDSYVELNENGKEIKETPISKYENKQKYGVFGKFLNLFKKKEKSKSTRKRKVRERAPRTKKKDKKKKKKGLFGIFGKKEKN